MREIGVIKSKDKSSLNTYIQNKFKEKNIFDLTDAEQRKLLGMLQGWIDSVEHKVEKNKHIFDR